MVALRLTIAVGSQCQRPLEVALSLRSFGLRHYCDVSSSTAASCGEEDGAHRGHCACELRAGPPGNCHSVQHRGWDGSGRRVRTLIGALCGHVDFYDHYFGYRRQRELRCVVVGDVAKFASDD